jgi:hypothetical protein
MGIRVDYLAPTIYLTDLIIGLLLTVNHKHLLAAVHKHWKIAGTILVIAGLNIVNAQGWQIAIVKWLKVLEFGGVSLLVYQKREEVKDIFLNVLPWTTLWVCMLALLQWVNGHTLGGVWYWLGERAFSMSTPGIALARMGNYQYLRPYATFPHPNTLAAFLAIAGIVLLQNEKTVGKKLLGMLTLLTIVLTNSQNIWVAGAIAGIVLVFIKQKWSIKTIKYLVVALIVLGIIMPYQLIVQNKTLSRYQDIEKRSELGSIAQMIILKNPLLGVGLGNFIAVLPTQNQKTEIIWWLQPVHNIYLLGLSEIGVIPVLVLLIISSNMWRTKKIKILVSAYPYLVLIMLSGILDHYWLTQQQTMILLSVILPLGIEEKKNI